MRVTVLACLVASCASVASRAPQPQNVVLRNASGADLHRRTVREPRETANASRLGTISPALDGRSYTFARRAGAAPLPDVAEVVWETRSGFVGSARVSLAAALKGATGVDDEAIVFELRSGGRVRVYLGQAEPSLYR